jgi:hypothetical protein
VQEHVLKRKERVVLRTYGPHRAELTSIRLREVARVLSLGEEYIADTDGNACLKSKG